MYTSVMPRRIALAPHLSVEEFEQRYKRAPTLAAARRYQAVWLIGQGHTCAASLSHPLQLHRTHIPLCYPPIRVMKTTQTWKG